MTSRRRPAARRAATVLEGPDFDEALEAARAPAPLYLLAGDPFLREEAVAAVRAKAGLAGPEGRMNVETIDGTEEGPEAGLARLAAVPFLAERRLLVVRRADPWLGARERAPVLAYAEAPPPHAVLVLHAEKTSLHVKRADRWEPHPVAAAAAARGGAATLRPPRDEREAGRWVAARARARGLPLSPEGVAVLLEAVGVDLASLAGEIEKLRTLYGDVPVGPAEVRGAVGAYREEGLDDFLAGLGRRDVERALSAIDRAPGIRREAVLWAAAAANRLRLIRRAEPLVDAGASSRTLIERLGLWPKIADEIRDAAGRFRKADLEAAVLALAALDRGLKGGDPAAHLARLDRFTALPLTTPTTSPQARS